MAWTARLAAGLCVAALTASPAVSDDGFDRLRAEADSARFNMEREAIEAVLGRLEVEMRLIARHVDGESAVAIRASIDGAAAMLVRRRPPGWPQNPARRAERPIAGVAEAVLAEPLVVRAIERFTDDGEFASLERSRAERSARLRGAQAGLAHVLLARELRLREPDLPRLGESLRSWLAASEGGVAPTGDVVVRFATSAQGSELLRPVQREVLLRQHFGVADAAPGQSWPQRRATEDVGRRPSDDYALEAEALASLQAWPPSPVARLIRCGVRLGETFEREVGFLPEQRRTYPLRPVVEPTEAPLWRALVGLTGREHGAEPAPGPARVGDDAALEAARVEVVLMALRHVAALDASEVETLRPAALEYVRHELSDVPANLPFVAPHDVLERLRLVPGGRPSFGTGSRRALVDSIVEVADDTQARALSIQR